MIEQMRFRGPRGLANISENKLASVSTLLRTVLEEIKNFLILFNLAIAICNCHLFPPERSFEDLPSFLSKIVPCNSLRLESFSTSIFFNLGVEELMIVYLRLLLCKFL